MQENNNTPPPSVTEAHHIIAEPATLDQITKPTTIDRADAKKGENDKPDKPKQKASRGPGRRTSGLEETLTETETAIVYALRAGLRCERSWRAADERDAWYYIHEMTEAILCGRDVEEFKNICDPDQFVHCYPAAVACAASVTAFIKGYRKTREKTKTH